MRQIAQGAGRKAAGLRKGLALLTVTLAWGPALRADVIAPAGGANLILDEPFEIRWDPLAGCSTVDISLHQGQDLICTVASGVPNDGSYLWTVDNCGLEAACNLWLRIGCGSASVASSRFGIDGLLIQSVESGDRSVTLRWRPVAADTLGAEDRSPGATGSVFGGYSVWRQTYDNQLHPTLRERFVKVRNYDVTMFGVDTVATEWSFPRDTLRFGDVEVQVGEDEFVTELRVLAQTFTVDDGAPDSLCSVRIFVGETVGRWETTARITRLTGGLPDTTQVIGRADSTFSTSQFWAGYAFSPRVPLEPGTYALVISGEVIRPNPPPGYRVSWVHARYDAYPGGTAFRSRDNGATWSEEPDLDFSFVLAGGPAGSNACSDFLGQRQGGDRDRVFRDPESIRVLSFEELESLPPEVISQITGALGPYNGFHLRYAVTSYDRVRVTSGNVEFISACEDTLIDPDTHLASGVAPSPPSVWTETLEPQARLREKRPLLEQVYPVPNPYIRDPESKSYPRWELPGERKIQFTNLPQGAIIRIHTVAGDHVRTLRHTGSEGIVKWDLCNEAGEPVATGIYLWLVETESGESKRGQLVIVL